MTWLDNQRVFLPSFLVSPTPVHLSQCFTSFLCQASKYLSSSIQKFQVRPENVMDNEDY